MDDLLKKSSMIVLYGTWYVDVLKLTTVQQKYWFGAVSDFCLRGAHPIDRNDHFKAIPNWVLLASTYSSHVTFFCQDIFICIIPCIVSEIFGQVRHASSWLDRRWEIYDNYLISTHTRTQFRWTYQLRSDIFLFGCWREFSLPSPPLPKTPQKANNNNTNTHKKQQKQNNKNKTKK